MDMQIFTRRSLGIVTTAFALFSTGTFASTVNFSFDTIAQNPGTVFAPSGGAGTPWLTLSVQDTATPGTVQLTVNTLLSTAGSPPQTLTGIWLNIPAVASSMTGISISATGTGTGQLPNGSSFSATQSLVAPINTVSGKYNIQLQFPNSGTTTSFQGIESETFTLTGIGSTSLNALSFDALALQTGAGLPNPSYYAMASLTNAGGTAGSGIAYIGALTATVVPIPAAAWMLGSGLLGLLSLGRRKAAA